MNIDSINLYVIAAYVAAYVAANIFNVKKRIICRNGSDRPYYIQKSVFWPFIWTDCFVSVSPYTDKVCRYRTQEEAEDAMKRLVL